MLAELVIFQYACDVASGEYRRTCYLITLGAGCWDSVLYSGSDASICSLQ